MYMINALIPSFVLLIYISIYLNLDPYLLKKKKKWTLGRLYSVMTNWIFFIESNLEKQW